MFRVLIVDDESFIVALIENLVQWRNFNMQVVGTADNGYSALEKVNMLKPDIVIVDVRMPGYDGISFMKKVREINSRIKFVVISGHKKFEYAKSAMQYNVEDYLIKPISKEELERILLKLKNKLEQEMRTEQIEEKRASDLIASQNQLRKYFMDTFVEKTGDMEKIGREEVNKEYLTNFQEGIYQVIILKTDFKKIKPDGSFMENLLFKMGQQVVELLKPICYEVLNVSRADCLYVVCNYNIGQQEKMKKGIQTYYDVTKEQLKKFEEICLTVCIGEAVDSFGMLGQSMRGGIRGVKGRTALGIQKIILSEELKEDMGIFDVVLSDASREKWRQVIRGFQLDQIKTQIFSFFSVADRYTAKDSLIFYKVLSALHRDFYEYIRKIDLYKSTYEEFYKELEKNLIWDFSGRMMASDFAKQIEKYIVKYAGNGDLDNNPAIKIAKKYIAENYQKNISMKGMAELVNLNPVYFSMLFKREVGINFLDYLNKYRLEISKQYLKQIQYNISEVTELSGFQDSKYFSKLFKKTFGITPTEYRKRNIKYEERRR